jgi:hypothetical protein
MNVSFVATVERVFDSTYALATLVMTFEPSLAGQTACFPPESSEGSNTGDAPVNLYVFCSCSDASLAPDDPDGSSSLSNSAKSDAAFLLAKKLNTMISHDDEMQRNCVCVVYPACRLPVNGWITEVYMYIYIRCPSHVCNFVMGENVGRFRSADHPTSWSAGRAQRSLPRGLGGAVGGGGGEGGDQAMRRVSSSYRTRTPPLGGLDPPVCLPACPACLPAPIVPRTGFQDSGLVLEVWLVRA